MRTWLKVSMDNGGIWMDSSVEIVERICELNREPQHFMHWKNRFAGEEITERGAFGGAGQSMRKNTSSEVLNHEESSWLDSSGEHLYDVWMICAY